MRRTTMQNPLLVASIQILTDLPCKDKKVSEKTNFIFFVKSFYFYTIISGQVTFPKSLGVPSPNQYSISQDTWSYYLTSKSD